MKSNLVVSLVLLGCLQFEQVIARPWINKDGQKIDAEFVSFDETKKAVTIERGDKEYIIALETLSETDQKWVVEHVAAMKENKVADEITENKPDEILLLLDKSQDEVKAALKTLKMTENLDSLKTGKLTRNSDGLEGIQYCYDSCKLKFNFFEDKLSNIDLNIKDGYSGVLPFGLKKSMTQIEATEALEKHNFKLTDWGTSPPGWGQAHTLISSPSRLVAIMTLKPQSKEIAVIRLKTMP